VAGDGWWVGIKWGRLRRVFFLFFYFFLFFMLSRFDLVLCLDF
jgi:hypothetical protein